MKERFGEVGRKLLYMQTTMQMTGNQLLRIENCRRILEYNDIRVVVQTTDLTLSIWGKNLRVDTYSAEGVLIQGELQSIELEKKGGRIR